MGKISPVSAKYIVHSTIEIDGIVDRPDVIGAIFGQTEGLLGADLELRELQRSGRIGRIEVNIDTKSGKSEGSILIPSSLDKAETAIVGAALEVIQRIGPCNAKIKVGKIEDVRVSKRRFVIDRAKELLKNLMDTSLPDSQELADEVAYAVRVMEVQEYGKERLPAGPTIEESDEIIVVEGRADVINLLKQGIKNSIAMNGTSVPETIIELTKTKTVTVFVDGDRGGSLIIKEIINVANPDFITSAPDGKEVEELTKKEIHMALRARVSAEQANLDMGKKVSSAPPKRVERREERRVDPRREIRKPTFVRRGPQKRMSVNEKKVFKEMLEDLIGTKGAYILDEKLNILGKVPFTELDKTVKSLGSGIYSVVVDGDIDKTLASTMEIANVTFLVGMDSKASQSETKVNIVTSNDL